MTYISSQKYIDYKIVDEKIAELQKSQATSISVPVWPVGFDDLYVVSDKHHTIEAAKELGLTIKFVAEQHPEGLTGENLLEQFWLDSDWYDIETGINVW